MPRCLTVSSVPAAAPETEAASNPVAMMILFIPFLLLVTNRFQCTVYRSAEPVDDHVDVVRCRDVRRCEQDVIAAAAVHRPAGRITGEAGFQRRRLDPLVEPEGGIRRRAAGAIGDPAGSRRQDPWRWPGCRAQWPPVATREACRCGPCRTSPRRG